MSNSFTAGDYSQVDNHFVFPKGIPGFSHLTEFVVIKQDDYFSYLQSVQDAYIAFIITDPFLFFPEYEFHIPEDIVTEYELDSVESLGVRCIVTWNKQPEKVTLNLQAPVVFNVGTRQAKQLILQNTQYTTKHPLYRQNRESGGS